VPVKTIDRSSTSLFLESLIFIDGNSKPGGPSGSRRLGPPPTWSAVAQRWWRARAQTRFSSAILLRLSKKICSSSKWSYFGLVKVWSIKISNVA